MVRLTWAPLPISLISLYYLLCAIFGHTILAKSDFAYKIGSNLNFQVKITYTEVCFQSYLSNASFFVYRINLTGEDFRFLSRTLCSD